MGDWKTEKTTEVEAGGKNFIEISEKTPPEGENTFISISKGWKTDEGEKRYKANVLFPKAQADEIIKAIENAK